MRHQPISVLALPGPYSLNIRRFETNCPQPATLFQQPETEFSKCIELSAIPF